MISRVHMPYSNAVVFYDVQWLLSTKSTVIFFVGVIWHSSVSLDMVHPSPRMDDRQKSNTTAKMKSCSSHLSRKRKTSKRCSEMLAWERKIAFDDFCSCVTFLSVIHPWWRKDHVHGFQLLKRCDPSLPRGLLTISWISFGWFCWIWLVAHNLRWMIEWKPPHSLQYTN